MLSEDPSVTTWRIALARHNARQPPPPPRRHWWRDLVTETWRAAHDHHHAMRESGHHVDGPGAAHTNVSAYQLEPEEFARLYPPPRLADVMRGLSQGAIAPGTWEAS